LKKEPFVEESSTGLHDVDRHAMEQPALQNSRIIKGAQQNPVFEVRNKVADFIRKADSLSF
jgi:hypothetical protein